jgi:flagellar biosynthesis/type III secretory pathway protein FliH
MKYEADEQSMIIHARSEGIELGKAEGIELGKAEGIELGIVEGIELGKVEGIELGKVEGIELGKVEGIELGKEEKARDMAEMSLLRGLEVDLIKELTGLTEEQILDIKTSIHDQ